MAFPQFSFPHIPRFFSATLLFVGLWAGFGVLLAVNGIAFTQNDLAAQYLPILTRPLTADAHARLATSLWDQGHTIEAKKEAELAQDLAGANVLGSATSGKELLAKWESEPQKQTQTLEYWKGVTEQKPDYRDGFIMAAVAAYQLGDTQTAQNFIRQAVRLDPTSTLAEELQTLFEKP